MHGSDAGRGRTWVGPGDHVLVARAEGTATGRVHVAVAAGTIDPERRTGVRPDGEPLEFRVTPRRVVRGSVTDASTGAPIARFLAGVIEFHGAALPLPPDGDELAFALEPLAGVGTIAVTAVDERGSPLREVQVACTWGLDRIMTRDAGGTVAVAGRESEPNGIRVTAPGRGHGARARGWRPRARRRRSSPAVRRAAAWRRGSRRAAAAPGPARPRRGRPLN